MLLKQNSGSPFRLAGIVHLFFKLRLLQNNQVHKEQLLEAIHLRAAATLANVAAGIRFDVVGSLPEARQKPA